MPARPATHPGDLEALDPIREQYVDALLAGDAITARARVDEALRLAPVADVYLRVVHLALVEIGVRWERGHATIAEEHLATSVCEVVLADLAGRLPQGARRNLTAIVACGPGELHAVGSRVVADFLDADGWDVLHLGAMTPAGVIAELAVARQAALVAISVSLPQWIPEVADVCRRLRTLSDAPVIALGGQAFSAPELALRAGADVTAPSPPELVAALAERFPREG